MAFKSADADRVALDVRVAAPLMFAVVFAFGFFLLHLYNDDAWITARYARNLAAGAGFVYNPGERVLGTTTPLLTMIFAAGMRVLAAGWAVRIISALALATCSVSFFIYGRRWGQPLAGFAAGMLFPLLPPVAFDFGNEIPLFTGLFLITAVLADQGRQGAAGFGAGLLGLTRGEGMLYGAVLAAWPACRRRWRGFLRHAVMMAAVVIPWLVFCRIYFGDWLPRTLGIKRLQMAGTSTQFLYHSFLYGEWRMIHSIWFSPVSVIGIAAWLGAARVWRRSGLILLAFAIFHCAVYTALRVPDYGWYHYAIFMFATWAGGCGVEQVVVWIRRIPAVTVRKTAAAFTCAIVIGAALARLVYAQQHNPTFIRSSDRFDRYRKVADYLAGHAQPGDTLMLDEIGIIGFHAWPVRVLDTNSLVHRDLSREQIGNPTAIAAALKPQWIKTYYSHGKYFAVEGAGGPLVYEQVADLDAPAGERTLYRQLSAVPRDYDFGLYEAENWGGVAVHWTRRAAEIPIEKGGRFRIRYRVGHPAISRENPVTVTFTINGAQAAARKHDAQGYFEQSFEPVGAPATLRIEVDHTWTSPEGRQLGIAVYPVEYMIDKHGA